MSGSVKLVLVDLDNIWDQGRPLPEPATSPDEGGNWLDSSGTPAPVDAGVPCVVVFARNLETAKDSRLSYDALQTLGERLSWLVAQAHRYAPPIVFEDRNARWNAAPSASTLAQNVMVLSAHSVQSVA